MPYLIVGKFLYIMYKYVFSSSHAYVISLTTCSGLEHLPSGSGGNVTVYLLRYAVSSSTILVVSATSSSDSSF